MKLNLLLLYALSLLLIASCNNETEENSEGNTGLIEITKEQFDSENMIIGTPAIRPFGEKLYFTGNIVPDVNGQAQISLSVPGKIEEVFIKPGQQIDKNTVMFKVSGNGLIDIQKEFVESAAKLASFKSDFLRTKDLYEDKIASEKEYTRAQSSYYTENASYNALKIKLEVLNLDVSKIEKGNLYSFYYLKSPIKGVVASINTSIGQYFDTQQKIAEVIDSQSYLLRLSIFENNINKIKVNQVIDFYLNGNKKERFEARIVSVGNIVMNDSKSIDCFAEIKNRRELNIVSNQYVEGEVLLSVDSALSVPETAIKTVEEEVYLLLLENVKDSIYFLNKVKVIAGRRNNKYVEIKEINPATKILFDGIYNITIE